MKEVREEIKRIYQQGGHVSWRLEYDDSGASRDGPRDRQSPGGIRCVRERVRKRSMKTSYTDMRRCSRNYEIRVMVEEYSCGWCTATIQVRVVMALE